MSRVAEIEKLRSRMRQHHFVAISGPRNCGKSRVLSELRSSLEREVRNMKENESRFKAKAGMKWKVAHIRLNRDDNPFDLLTKAIAGPTANILVGANEKVDPLFESSIKQALLTKDGHGLLNIYRQFLQIKQYNFLVIVDQFENLFFTTILSQEQKHMFVRLLLNASFDQRQIYVTVALRPPKADLWKQNFRDLHNAVEACHFRLYNPNQQALEAAIGDTFIQERVRVMSDDSETEVLSPEWLKNQEIYQQVAVKRIKQISEDLYDVLKVKWKKMQKDGNPGASKMVPADNVKMITKQLRGIVDVIWPQLLLQSNIGALEADEREELVEHLKWQLTEVLTDELLRRLSGLLAEELYFENEPLVQIEKNVRQLVRDWAEVLDDIRKEGGRRKPRQIVTVTMAEQKAGTIGAASSDFKVDRSGPVEKRAEAAYQALRSALDKRIATKALTVLGRNAKMASGQSALSVESLVHAMGRFASRLIDVLEVFAHAGVLEVDPPGTILMESMINLSDPDLADKWERMKLWIFGKSGSMVIDNGLEDHFSEQGSQRQAEAPTLEFSMEFKEDFGASPNDAAEAASRANTIYESLMPSLRKRAAQRLLVAIVTLDPQNKGVGQAEVLQKVGRFEAQLRDLIEYFIRQGILAPEGGLHFKEPSLPQKWERLAKWIKEDTI
ncbi:MAG: hypothetical protein IPN95_12690 [Bacteroidetes bacterium]|nr:hypothetical protein [Bacteroidota bacterium]MBL0019863.1 hypothetical protein [Bacteroidota bacterium]MBP6639368.1 hypothetical protein [Bacteroidia bacterium]MBP6722429.1 hypothetical protein [Bacteroidia bacterium]